MSEKSLFIQATDIIRARDERIAALEAEVAQNETDLLRLNDLLDTAEAERDALRAEVESWQRVAGLRTAELDAHLTRTEKAEAALRTLLDRMERIEASEAYRSVWVIAQIHAGPYHGETWAVERAAAHAALRGTGLSG